MWGQKLWGGCELARRLLHHLSPTPVGEKARPWRKLLWHKIALRHKINHIPPPESSRKQFRKPWWYFRDHHNAQSCALGHVPKFTRMAIGNNTIHKLGFMFFTNELLCCIILCRKAILRYGDFLHRQAWHQRCGSEVMGRPSSLLVRPLHHFRPIAPVGA